MNRLLGLSLLVCGCASGSRTTRIDTMPLNDKRACAAAVKYPHKARDMHIQGTVHLTLRIDQRGTVTSVEIIDGPGYGLEEAARDALLHECVFTPAFDKSGKSLPSEMPYTMEFYL